MSGHHWEWGVVSRYGLGRRGDRHSKVWAGVGMAHACRQAAFNGTEVNASLAGC